MLAAVLLGGCLDYEDDQIQWSEDFENGVAMWNQAGDVTVVTTNHPGEHAVRLGVDASIAHGLGITRQVDTDSDPYGDGFTDGNWIEYSSDCPGRPALALEPMTTPPERTTPVRVRLVLEGPPIETFTRDRLMFPALPAFIAPPEGDPWDPPPDQYTIQFGSLLIETTAPCRVDNLRIMVSGGTLGY